MDDINSLHRELRFLRNGLDVALGVVESHQESAELLRVAAVSAADRGERKRAKALRAAVAVHVAEAERWVDRARREVLARVDVLRDLPSSGGV